MYPPTQIDPVVSFLNAQGEALRGTVVSVERRALVMEIYNTHVQISEVMNELTLRGDASVVYTGKAIVTGLFHTGLTAMVSLRLVDEWREMAAAGLAPGAAGRAAQAFVREWDERARIRAPYQIAINEARTYLTDLGRWLAQADASDALPRDGAGRLRADVLAELSEPLMARLRRCLDHIDGEAAQVGEEQAVAHRAFAQAALHPLVLRAPFVFRAYSKPLGRAGDYQMVNQLLDDPRQGPGTYFQVINAAFLDTPVAQAHRDRIGQAAAFLRSLADAARAAGRPFRVLDLGCGPAIEVQRFLREDPEPHWLQFTLADVSAVALDWTRSKLAVLNAELPRPAEILCVNDSIDRLLKRHPEPPPDAAARSGEFDAVVCTGLFDYLPDKACARLMAHAASRLRRGARVLAGSLHGHTPCRHALEHLLEWHLVYRDEAQLRRLMPTDALYVHTGTGADGCHVFAEAVLS